MHNGFIDDYSGGFASPIMDAIYFYKKDELIKTLHLGEVLENMCSVTLSVSHMHWLLGFGFDTPKSYKITTSEFFEYRFNFDGKILSKISDKRIKPKDKIIVALVKRIGSNKYELDVKNSIRGSYEVNQKLIIDYPDRKMKKRHGKFYGLFTSRKKKLEAGFFSAILMRNDLPLETDFSFPIYNSPNYCNFINRAFKNK